MTDTLFFIDEDEVLAHHGVKGMKWGVRKQRAASGGAGSNKKRKGLSRKQKAAIAGVLGTAAAAGAGYYLHKSGKGKKIAALAKKGGASAKKYAEGKGRNLGAQARVKTAQAKRFAKAQSANAKGAADKLKTSKAGKYAEATRLGANAAKFKAATAARSAGTKAKNQAWKAGNKARKAAAGGTSGLKSAAGSAARSAKSAASKATNRAKSAASKATNRAKSAVGKKTPGKALSTQVRSGGVGRPKLVTGKVKTMRRMDRNTRRKLAAVGAGAYGLGFVGAATGSAARSAKSSSQFGKALSTQARSGGVGYRKLATKGSKVVGERRALAKAAATAVGTAAVGGAAMSPKSVRSIVTGIKDKRSRKRRR